MRKDGLSHTNGIIVTVLILLLCGVIPFITGHGFGEQRDPGIIMFLISLAIATSGGICLVGLIDANENEEVEQKKLSNCLMGGIIIFLVFIVLESSDMLGLSILGPTFGILGWNIHKEYVYELVTILVYPFLMTYIVRAIGDEGIGSQKAKTAYLQILVITVIEFLLVMKLHSVWILVTAISNTVTFMVVINNSSFGRKISHDDKARMFILYSVTWLLVLFVFCGTRFLNTSGLFYEDSWMLHRKYTYEIIRHASFVGTSSELVKSQAIIDFLESCRGNVIGWLLFYGGWITVIVYVAVMIGVLYFLYKALCVSLRRENVMYPLYFMIFFNILFRILCGLTQNFGLLPIPAQLPFSTTTEVFKDILIVALLIEFGAFNKINLWDNEIEELFEEKTRSMKIKIILCGICCFIGFYVFSIVWCYTFDCLNEKVLTLREYDVIEKQAQQEREGAERLKEVKENFGIYADFVLDKEYEADFLESHEAKSYEVADIDNNGVSELLISPGIFSAAATWIYTMNDDEVEFLGSYSKYGELVVYKGKDHCIIRSEYGNQGAFTHVYTRMENGKPEIIAVFFCDGTGLYSDEVLYYMGFPYTVGERADQFDIDYDILTDQYLVSEEEYWDAQAEFVNSPEYVKEIYSCPNPVK